MHGQRNGHAGPLAGLDPAAQARAARKLRRKLLAHYGDLGPQYPLLVERLVQAHLRATASDAQGHLVDAEEHRKDSEAVLRAVAALQKYTESLKQEVIQKKVETAVIRVVEIIEAVVLPVAPQLWNDCIAAIAERAPRLD
jgi:hypothetical protein